MDFPSGPSFKTALASFREAPKTASTQLTQCHRPARRRSSENPDTTSTRASPEDYLSIRFGSLEELDEWAASQRVGLADKFRVPREDISDYHRTKIDQGKTDMNVIVCHDYKNNYLSGEDELPVGYFPHSSGKHYFLQYPSLVDVFIYFSHNKVSVPPVTWTNALHKQGVLSLGTLILEGNDHRQLDRLVETQENGDFKYVTALVKLAKHYRFDGWLVNIETTFSNPSLGPKIVEFTESLKSELHKANSHSKVIWYDSFIGEKNKIFYQNGVNEWNYNHFESSDYFFTNYWWDEELLRRNITHVGLTGVKRKLYVGIDVWGRGTKVGSGGFETGLAINFLRVYSSNVALFAPAWTYENFNKSQFLPNDQQFWIGDITDEYPGGSVATYIAHYSTPVYYDGNNLKFYTNFSLGEGNGYNVFGKTIFSEKWVHGGLQQVIPSEVKLGYLEVVKNDAFNGGSSLKAILKRSTLFSSRTNVIKLFQFQDDVRSKGLNVSISYKTLSELPPDSFFQLEVTYYVERRFRSVTRVRDGAYTIPLKFSKSWRQLETALTLPTLKAKEHFVLAGAQINWVFEGGGASLNDLEQSWIMVSGYNDTTYDLEILLGDLLIEGVENTREPKSIKKVKKTTYETESQVFVEWTDEKEVLHWLIYVNAKFVTVSTTPGWILERTDRLRVDCFTRSGKLIKGDDIFI